MSVQFDRLLPHSTLPSPSFNSIVMRKSKALKLRSKHNLPEEIWLEILSRLPVKSLLRFRCVSPSWKIWIDDPSFTPLHLSRYNNRSSSPIPFVQGRKLVVKNSETLRTICTLSTLQSDLESAHVLRSTPARFDVGVRNWNIVSSVNGLFLLECYQRLNLMLWNPSIRKILALPPIPQIATRDYFCMATGLGFDSLISDYKVVRSVRLVGEEKQFVTVYTLKTNSWKVNDCPLRFRGWKSSTNFDGILYGIAKDDSTGVMKLVSFDWRSEVFASFKLPSLAVVYLQPDHETWTKRSLTTIDDGRSLAVVYLQPLKGSIWVMERLGDMVRWTNRYTFDTIPRVQFDNYDFLCIKKNGEMLIRWYNKVICCNLETQEKKILLEKNGKSLEAVNVGAYMESLMMHTWKTC